MSPRKKAVALASDPTATPPEASRDAIAMRAYEFFTQRGYAHGRDLDDWLQAERELLANPALAAGANEKKPARRKKSDVLDTPSRASAASASSAHPD